MMLSFSGLTIEVIELIENFNSISIYALDRAGNILSTRSDESSGGGGDTGEHGVGIIILAIINLFIFVPAVLFLSYTLSDLIPILAAVEDDHALEPPPPYERVPRKEDVIDDEAGQTGIVRYQRPLTSSLRSTLCQLCSISGCASLLRGLGYLMLLNISMVVVSLGLSSIPFIPVPLGTLAASLICLPLNILWVHTVISAPSSEPFWRRFPNLKTTYRAVTLPTLAYFLAVAIAHGVPRAVMFQGSSGSGGWRGLAAVGLALLLDIVLVIPSHVVLNRVQASLLSTEAATIVPFKRSDSLDGRGYLSMGEAWASISHASWSRVVKIYVKTFIAAVAVEVTVLTLMLLEAAFLVYLKH